MSAHDPPEGSQIETKTDFDGMILLWKRPSGGPVRFLVIGFLILWLCGWCVGFVTAGTELLSGRGPTGFLAVWLAGWTLGGVFAGGLVYLLLRRQVPESVTLERNRIKYDTGAAPMNFFSLYWMISRKQSSNPFSMIFPKRKIYEFSRSECPAFVLEGLGDDQRLRFDHGADRVVIGEYLKEPEREWLAQILNTWRTG